MRIDPGLLATFARAAWETFDLSGFDIDQDKALGAMEAEFRDDFEELNSQSVMRRRWRNCGIPDTNPADYAERIVNLSAKESVLCGIRHFGMDLEKPFVRLWPNFPISDAEQARRLYREHLSGLFTVFAPKWAQFLSPSGTESDDGGSLCLLAQAGTVARQRPWPGEAKIALRAPIEDNYYQWYSNIHDDFQEASPELRGRVTKNDYSLMEECRAQDLLRVVEVDRERVGLIAAERAAFLWHEGIYFDEIILESSWRGKGLARAIQRKFVEERSRPGDLIWGKIEALNRASLAVALANGRRVVRGECFARLSDF